MELYITCLIYICQERGGRLLIIQFSNFSIRILMGELIRRCFIHRDGNHIIEIDYSGIEVLAQWYHHDRLC